MHTLLLLCLLLLHVQLADRVECTPSYHPALDAVLIGCYDARVYALDRSTGVVLWSVLTGDVVKACPVRVPCSVAT